jgi:hypothetical protein
MLKIIGTIRKACPFCLQEKELYNFKIGNFYFLICEDCLLMRLKMENEHKRRFRKTKKRITSEFWNKKYMELRNKGLDVFQARKELDDNYVISSYNEYDEEYFGA